MFAGTFFNGTTLKTSNKINYINFTFCLLRLIYLSFSGHVPVAQRIEHLPSKQMAVGSIPTRDTIFPSLIF